MENVKQFNDFLNDHVNLGKGSLELLDRNVDAIFGALKADEELNPLIVKKDPQGSWAHRTIIKPQKDREFDADFMLVLRESDDWSDPVEYRNAIKRALNRSDKYKTMPVSHSCRAVTVTYADSHVDIVPFLSLSDGRNVIVNGDDNEWEDANPQSFTNWMRERDDITDRNFREVVRLMKYLRDNSDWAGTKSIILTTLLGDRVSAMKTIFDPNYYGDVPTTLVRLVEDLNDWLQAQPGKPEIRDPSGTGLSFDHRWNEPTFQRLKDRISGYASAMRDAYDAQDEQDSLDKWAAIFGDDFPTDLTDGSRSEGASKFGVGAAGAGAAGSSSSHSGRAG
ncbi:SMODS domain-containing nucleotidyltransferase [Phycicoccus duodecadis]|uniref:Nucleotidyltransferase n=1 Tax=Phycicoccus duodecadis TaxID=173053 RepID=A0A2N3YFY3_9MICO|nr:nucleotidyltransferase [Phycicoccus duodecadis]PKW25739.1 hypothetical protein ATL31_0539 [Phycicoccus duodecadis]